MSSPAEILSLLKSGTISIEDAEQQILNLKLSEIRKVSYKVSQKGAISFTGIRRLPITLYREELERIIEISSTEEFKNFLSNNAESLSSKEKYKN